MMHTGEGTGGQMVVTQSTDYYAFGLEPERDHPVA